MILRPSTVVVLGLALVTAAGPARAGGLFVPGFDPSAQPRAGAFVAKADDPSALYYNPAGFAKQHGTSLHVGSNFVDLSQSFQRYGRYEPPDMQQSAREAYVGQKFGLVQNDASPQLGVGGFQAIPTFSVATDLGGRTPLHFGFGVIAEQGYPNRSYASYDFQAKDIPPPPQRYDALEQEVTAAFPSVAVAYEVNPKLDIGLRLSWGIGGLKATTYLWGVRNYSEDVHSDGVFHAEVADYFIPAAQLGVLFRPTTSLELGASYVTKRSVNATGNGTSTLGTNLNLLGMHDFIAPVTGIDGPQCADGGTLTALKTCIDFALPQVATLGGRLVARDAAGAERGDLELDVQYEGWGDVSDIDITVDGKSGLTGLKLQPAVVRHGFQDAYSFRLGGAWNLPAGANQLILRGGAAYDTAAAPLSWTRLDLDGIERLTLGGGLGLAMKRMRIDAGLGYVLEPARVVVPRCNPSTANPGCDGTGKETPVAGRDAPDPVQPLSGAGNQVQSPFNSGRYKQHYVIFSLGYTYLF